MAIFINENMLNSMRRSNVSLNHLTLEKEEDIMSTFKSMSKYDLSYMCSYDTYFNVLLLTGYNDNLTSKDLDKMGSLPFYKSKILNITNYTGYINEVSYKYMSTDNNNNSDIDFDLVYLNNIEIVILKSLPSEITKAIRKNFLKEFVNSIKKDMGEVDPHYINLLLKR